MKKCLLLLIFIYNFVNAQQSSNVTISGNKNNSKTLQTGTHDSQKSTVNITGDSNYNEVNQVQDTINKKKENEGILNKIKNTNDVFVLLISIATFIGLMWKGFPFIKKLIGKK